MAEVSLLATLTLAHQVAPLVILTFAHQVTPLVSLAPAHQVSLLTHHTLNHVTLLDRFSLAQGTRPTRHMSGHVTLTFGHVTLLPRLNQLNVHH